MNDDFFDDWGLVVEEKRVRVGKKPAIKQTKKNSILDFLKKNRDYIIERGRIERLGEGTKMEKGCWSVDKERNQISYYLMMMNKKVWLNQDSVGKKYIYKGLDKDGFVSHLNFLISKFESIEEGSEHFNLWTKQKVEVKDTNGNVKMRINKSGNSVKETATIISRMD